MEGVDAMAGSKARSSGRRAQSDMHGRVSTSACPHRLETRCRSLSAIASARSRINTAIFAASARQDSAISPNATAGSPALAQLRFEQIGLRSKPRGLRVLP